LVDAELETDIATANSQFQETINSLKPISNQVIEGVDIAKHLQTAADGYPCV
jgi:hypothetical protein